MPALSRLWRPRSARASHSLLLAVLILASGVAAGCGEDDTPEAGDTGGTASAPAPTPAEKAPREDTGAPDWSMTEPDAPSPEAEPPPAQPTAPEAPAPEPPVAEAPTPEAPAEIVDRDDHVDFALDFLGRQGFNSVPGFLDLYASEVRYYDLGVVSIATVAEDKAAYFERWPNRYFELAGPVRARGGAAATIRFDYAFAVSHADASGEREGRAWVELGLRPSGDGYGYVITSERGGTY